MCIKSKCALKLLIPCGLYLLSLSSPGFCQIGHGTVEAYYFSRKQIVIAADSRVTRMGIGSFNDTECKIVPLDKHNVFFETGVSDFVSIPGVPIEPWNNSDEARRSYELAAASGEPNRLLRAASNWMQQTLKHLDAAYRILPMQLEETERIQHGGLIDAFWAGIGEDGNLQFLHARIGFKKTKPSTNVSGTRVLVGELQPNGVGLGWGAVSVGEELYAALNNDPKYMKTSKSTALQQWIESLQQINLEHWAVLTAIHVVEMAVEGGALGSGLPVDALELSSKDGIRWERRKPNCPAD